ncbi:FAD/NAD-P-binding domain-containing protein [Mycena galopus ATCC 62051]|nr:FAD/NAD-P-binding domain-containing protein [Mycena galopus ATCC 62051]
MSTTSTTTVPSSTDVLIIGGGPAGSYAASALAREGINVTLLEKDLFPRYHIGETFLSAIRPFLRFIDAEEKIKKFGFAVKVGAAVKLNQHKREGYTDFTLGGADYEGRHSWSVTRADFDDILFRHAEEQGATIVDGVQITSIKFSTENPDRPVAAEWKSAQGTGEIKFNWLVDCSGRNGIMSTRYLKNRKFNQALKNIAFWGYWEDHGMYGKGTSRENAPWFEALTDETGWAWFIPLAGNKVSVGVVLNEISSRTKKAQQPDLEAHYRTQLALCPGLMKLLGEKGRLVTAVKSGGDYSYATSNDQYSGPGYRICGDAGAFLDPLFSSGVHLAFTSALSAAVTIRASVRGQCTEDEAIKFHNQKTAVSYTRFMIVVLGVYKQIHNQDSTVLSDISEDNFDRAFDFIRPVIQGDADSGKSKAEEIQKAINFCGATPGVVGMDPEIRDRLIGGGADPTLLEDNGPFMESEAIASLSGQDAEAQELLTRMNSRKAITGMYNWAENFDGDHFAGFGMVLEKGNLGLKATAA